MTKLEELISIIAGEKLYIQAHNYPDQDALACAYALQYLLKVKGISADIIYKGEIDKLNTVSMVNVIGIEIKNLDEIGKMDKASQIILVDGQKGNANVVDFIGDEIACIDHHETTEKNETSSYRFSDIRSGIGACSSIIAQYYIENSIEMPAKVATALLYGIKMDTNNLSRSVSDLDIDMFYYLFKKADRDNINEFDSCLLKMQDLKAYADGINNLKVFDGMGIAKMEDDCPEAILGSMADFILSLGEVTISVIYSRRGGGIKYSVRSENKKINSAEMISKVLEGYGSGGGHSAMAAGFIPDIRNERDAVYIGMIIEQRIIDYTEERLI
jgi:nanoRNase/pAp phosphatase (c-di-AMP/oligoRNAs hydrolase)